jgi:hypothetical protein
LALSAIPPARNTQRHSQPPEPQTTAGFLSYHSSVVNVPLACPQARLSSPASLPRRYLPLEQKQSNLPLAHSVPAPRTPKAITAYPWAQVLTLPPPRFPVKSANLCFSSSSAALSQPPHPTTLPFGQHLLQKQSLCLRHYCLGETCRSRSLRRAQVNTLPHLSGPGKSRNPSISLTCCSITLAYPTLLALC